MPETKPTTEIVEPPVQVAAVTEPVTPPAPVEEPFDKDRAMQTIQKLREIEKQAKQEKKELEQLRAEKKQKEDSELTESERLKKENAELAAENAKTKADILKRDVIAETGLPAIFADRLKGTTKEEMLADAQELAKTLPTLKVPPHVPPTNPNNGSSSETDAARRERLFGRQGNPFDFEQIKQKGGGVVWNK